MHALLRRSSVALFSRYRARAKGQTVFYGGKPVPLPRQKTAEKEARMTALMQEAINEGARLENMNGGDKTETTGRPAYLYSNTTEFASSSEDEAGTHTGAGEGGINSTTEPRKTPAEHSGPLLPNPRVFMDIAVGGRNAGRLDIELFQDVLPITSENFRALCTGETGLGYWLRPRWYRGVSFGSIVPGQFCRGGDFNYMGTKGLMGESIYGQRFQDEGFLYQTSRRGLLCMAKGRDRHSQNSQFFFTLCADDTEKLNADGGRCHALQHMDGKYVVFGQVVAEHPTDFQWEQRGVHEKLLRLRELRRISNRLRSAEAPAGGSGESARQVAAQLHEAVRLSRRSVLDAIESVGTEGGVLRAPVTIWNCGEYDRITQGDRFVVQRARPPRLARPILGQPNVDVAPCDIDPYHPMPASVLKAAERCMG